MEKTKKIDVENDHKWEHVENTRPVWDEQEGECGDTCDSDNGRLAKFLHSNIKKLQYKKYT